MTMTTKYRCDCGEITGVPCGWTGPLGRMALVEWMPLDLRDSHTAADNSGTYPANGADRVAVCADCADMLDECEDVDWYRRLGRLPRESDASRASVTVTPCGGIRFGVRYGSDFLGHVEYGTLDEDEQYVEDDDEISDYVRAQYGLDEDVPITVQ